MQGDSSRTHEADFHIAETPSHASLLVSSSVLSFVSFILVRVEYKSYAKFFRLNLKVYITIMHVTNDLQCFIIMVYVCQ